MSNKAIIIFGPPGSGKGTQAHNLTDSFSLCHVDTGRLIEKTVHDPQNQNDEIIKRERELFDKGILNTPEWVVDIVRREIKRCDKEGKSIIFSGSPRTLFEAKMEFPLLEEVYGKENIKILKLVVKPETSIFRNSHRRVCEKCGRALVYKKGSEEIEKCLCGGSLVMRILDTPEAIKVRLQEYENRTKPIFEFLRERGYEIINIDGESDPEAVQSNIKLKLDGN